MSVWWWFDISLYFVMIWFEMGLPFSFFDSSTLLNAASLVPNLFVDIKHDLLLRRKFMFVRDMTESSGTGSFAPRVCKPSRRVVFGRLKVRFAVTYVVVKFFSLSCSTMIGADTFYSPYSLGAPSPKGSAVLMKSRDLNVTFCKCWLWNLSSWCVLNLGA